MEDHQEHFGRSFYLDKKKGYWISTDYPRIRAHRWVWMKIHGIIPKGYHIHHRNDNKSDNRIENLELIERSRHLSHHMQDPIRKKLAAQNCERIRPLTKAWHASEEGKAWHKLHGIACWRQRKSFEVECSQCGKKSVTKVYRQKFCSNNCKSQARRESGVDNIGKVCIRCGGVYVDNKYGRRRTCGWSCPSLR